MRLSYRQLRLSIHLDHGAGVAVTGGQRDELVEAVAVGLTDGCADPDVLFAFRSLA